MDDIPVYMIANLHIKDEEEYRNYEKGFFPMLKKHEGEFFTYDDNIETFEGVSPPGGRVIIFSFPSEEKAKSWYADKGYQELSEHRRASSELKFLTMVHGLPPRG